MYGLPPGPRSGPPPGPPPRPLSGSPPISRHGPPSISALPPPGISHSLPPRPPRAHRDVHELPRDSRNKRKHDRHNRNRENRQKKNNARSQLPNHKAKSDNRQPESKATAVSKSPVAPQHEEPPPQKTLPKVVPEISSTVSNSKENDPATLHVDANSPNGPNGTPDDLSETDDGEWEIRAIFNELEPPHAPDEVGKPLPASYSEQVLLPRKWDAKCIDSDFVKPDNLEEYIKPIHEKPDWNLIEFDPAFVRDGKLPCGDPLPRLPLQADHFDKSNSSENEGEIEQIQKYGLSGSHTPEVRPPKRRRSNSPSYSSPRGGEDNDISGSMWESHEPRSRKVRRRDNSHGRNTDRRDVTHRRSPSRRQPYSERGPSRTRSPSSRRSSVSNASSGLDSLEAELLGRPDKAKSPDDATKRRQSSSSNNKPRKRQPRLDAAYRFEKTIFHDSTIS
ncbi:hypothetical protein QQZ08_003504 [Neonectria magnoliae]|uniref:Uncharacterized protein n=1 Tax=Neonectria magnoliae TaxID=2732573 RepID=A0ABR1I8H8_9HYPO